MTLLREQPGNTVLNILGGFPGVLLITDRPSDNDVIGALQKRFLYVNGSLLVVNIGYGPNTGDDNKKFVPEFIP